MTNTCLTCQAMGCGGLQYDYYRNVWYCPIFNVKVVTDNKTTMLKDTYVNNGTTLIGHTEGERTI